MASFEELQKQYRAEQPLKAAREATARAKSLAAEREKVRRFQAISDVAKHIAATLQQRGAYPELELYRQEERRTGLLRKGDVDIIIARGWVVSDTTRKTTLSGRDERKTLHHDILFLDQLGTLGSTSELGDRIPSRLRIGSHGSYHLIYNPIHSLEELHAAGQYEPEEVLAAFAVERQISLEGY